MDIAKLLKKIKKQLISSKIKIAYKNEMNKIDLVFFDNCDD